jgi:TRAP-type C4-dicarboxylate transport system permease small subunit
MKAHYVRAMDMINRACLFVAGVCLVVITLIIPYGVFCRYVLNSAASWPEPMAVLLMIWLSLLSAVVCYREHLHIGVGVLPAALSGTPKLVLGWILEMGMLATNLFMLWWGTKLVSELWHQSIAEFPAFSTGASYLPIPIGGALIVLYVIERLWTGKLFEEPSLDGTPLPSE